ncbi:MAG: nucleoside recognition domain-containing protein [Bythopirellula sp.]|nr:nucleoside recognition domain-containing protein [Bythopirellula sp.]
MLNKIWFGMLVIGIVYGFGKAAWNSWNGDSAAQVPAAVAAEGVATQDGPVPRTAEQRDHRNLLEMGKDMNKSIMDSATTAVDICIKLIGFMALWLGILRIAQDSGMVAALARLMRPLMRWLFPEVPDGHPAQGAILMNLSANILGLDNAATPFGLKAMEELQTLNPHKDTATNSMAMFLAINTSSIVLIPFTLIGYRAIKGSEDPVGPLMPIILSTLLSTLVAIFITRTLSKSPRFAVKDSSSESPDTESEVSA